MNRRLTINPTPLKMAETRMGEGGAEKVFIICSLYTVPSSGIPQRLRRRSIHLDGCKRIPVEWHQKKAANEAVSLAVDEAAQAGIETAISCRSCRGWAIT